jgi:predicted outer membrane protein
LAGRRLVRLGGWTAVVTAALIAGCAPKRPAPPAPPSPVAPVAPAVALDPESYMAFTASSALFGVQSSRMAEARGSPKVKNFASKVVMDQTGIGAQLSFAGRYIDLLPSSRLLPEHQAMLDRLATAADFDGTYKGQLARVLREAAAAHRAFEASGDSPTLRPVARFAAPVCEKNLAALQKL